MQSDKPGMRSEGAAGEAASSSSVQKAGIRKQPPDAKKPVEATLRLWAAANLAADSRVTVSEALWEALRAPNMLLLNATVGEHRLTVLYAALFAGVTQPAPSSMFRDYRGQLR